MTTGSAAMIVLFFLLGFASPVIALRILAKRRLAKVEGQLPDVLATIASSLRVGHGLKQALQTVAADGAPPLSVELRRVLSEARLGRPFEEALVSMCERLGSDDLIYVATAVDVQSQVGGSLAGVFDTVAETVRERQQHRRRVRALTSTGRSTAIVMAVMPFGFLGLLLVVSPHYVTPFLEQSHRPRADGAVRDLDRDRRLHPQPDRLGEGVAMVLLLAFGSMLCGIAGVLVAQEVFRAARGGDPRSDASSRYTPSAHQAPGADRGEAADPPRGRSFRR